MSVEMTLQARMRRLQDTLAIVGVGVIAFGAWTVAKAVMFFLIYGEDSQRQLYQIGNDVPMFLFYVTFAIMALIDLSIRLFIGMSAHAEGQGKRKGNAYLVLAAIMALSSLSSIVMIAFGISYSPSAFDLVMTIIIEATSALTLALMVFCAVRLRRLRESAG